jgi:hypothetical protein
MLQPAGGSARLVAAPRDGSALQAPSSRAPQQQRLRTSRPRPTEAAQL